MLKKKSIVIIGGGKMGETLVGGLLEAGLVPKARIRATDVHPERVKCLRERYKVKAGTDNVGAVRASDIVLLAVKPQIMRDVLEEIKGEITPRHLVISIAASVTTTFIERILGDHAVVVRVMPNTPCLIRQGMSGLCAGRHAKAHDLDVAKQIFGALGRCLVLDEKHLDAVTALSASGPAFLYVIVEALAEGGVKVGLPRDLATELAAQTMLGTAQMVLQTGEHPAKLKDAVTTPAGCTIDGLLQLEEGGLRVTLIKAVVTATKRATELVNG